MRSVQLTDAQIRLLRNAVQIACTHEAPGTQDQYNMRGALDALDVASPAVAPSAAPSRGLFVLLRSGVRWHPFDPRPEDVRSEDFRSLAFIARWGGHAGEVPYSVAEHSVRVARLLADWGAPVELQLQGLVHDLHEIYPPGDLSAPILRGGRLADAADDMASKAKYALRKAIGVAPYFDPMVKRADLVLLVTEDRDLMPADPWVSEWKDAPAPLVEKIEPWRPSLAWFRWADLYEKLGGKWPNEVPTIQRCAP